MPGVGSPRRPIEQRDSSSSDDGNDSEWGKWELVSLDDSERPVPQLISKQSVIDGRRTVIYYACVSGFPSWLRLQQVLLRGRMRL